MENFRIVAELLTSCVYKKNKDERKSKKKEEREGG